LYRNDTELRAAKAAAEARGSHLVTPPPASAAAVPMLTAGLNQLGLGAGSALFAVPPDTTGAIGPADFVQEVNDGVAVFRRADLAPVAGPLLNEIFMHAPSATLVSDPQMQWDQQGGRWIYLAQAFSVDFANLSVGGPDFLLFGFSKTSDPTDLTNGWCRYSLASGSAPDGAPLLDDYPKLGHDDRHLIFGANIFEVGGSGAFDTARIWSVPKPPPGPLSSCPGTPVATIFGSPASPLRNSDGSLASTPVPANTFNASPAGYVVAAHDPTSGPQHQIMAWHVGGTATAPTLVQDGEITVPVYRVPRPALDFIFPPIDTLDGRLTMAVANADPAAGGQEAVWTQHTVDPGNGSVVMRWYELLPRFHTARQVGTVTAPGMDVYNGAVSPAADGADAALVYNRSGFLSLPQLDAGAHLAGMPAGSVGASVALGNSTAPDFDISCTPVCRWGDYSGASPDPLASGSVWVDGQVIAPPGGLLPSWSTRIAELNVSAG
jgi:hypothetical protein